MTICCFNRLIIIYFVVKILILIFIIVKIELISHILLKYSIDDLILLNFIVYLILLNFNSFIIIIFLSDLYPSIIAGFDYTVMIIVICLFSHFIIIKNDIVYFIDEGVIIIDIIKYLMCYMMGID